MRTLLIAIQFLTISSLAYAGNIQAEAYGYDSLGKWADIATWFWIGVFCYYFILPFFRDK